MRIENPKGLHAWHRITASHEDEAMQVPSGALVRSRTSRLGEPVALAMVFVPGVIVVKRWSVNEGTAWLAVGLGEFDDDLPGLYRLRETPDVSSRWIEREQVVRIGDIPAGAAAIDEGQSYEPICSQCVASKKLGPVKDPTT
jgi:hypothetical protein